MHYHSKGSNLRKTAGFTLIELLVVIAIIAILAAILFPVFANAKATAKLASCTSNLKQVSSAFRLYLDDWGGVMPQSSTYAIFGDPATTGWTEIVYKYTGNKIGIFKCPDRKVNFGYTYNGSIGHPDNRMRAMNPPRPSKLIVVFESPGSGFGPINTNSKGEYVSGNADQTNEGQNDGEVYNYPFNTKFNPDDAFENYQWLKPIVKEQDDKNLKQSLHSRLYFPGPHQGRCTISFYDGHVANYKDWATGKMTFVP